MGGLETEYPLLSGRRRTRHGVRGWNITGYDRNDITDSFSASLARTVSERLRSESVWLMKEVRESD